MRRLLRRQALAYVLGLATALAGFAVGAAWAGHSADSNTITACELHGNGGLYLVDRGSQPNGCRDGDQTVTWSITGPQGPQGIQGPKGDRGPQGPAGSFNGAVSANGLYRVSFGNRGVTISGPLGRLIVDSRGVHMNTIGGATP